MSTKTIIWICVFALSIVGGYIPSIFGAGLFSFWGIIGSGVGGILGIWVGLKIGDYLNG